MFEGSRSNSLQEKNNEIFTTSLKHQLRPLNTRLTHGPVYVFNKNITFKRDWIRPYPENTTYCAALPF